MCKNSEVILDLPGNIAIHRQNRTVCVDSCIADTIKHLWNKGCQTLGCCCGHGKNNPSIIIPEKYNNIKILAIFLELSQIDKRIWDILQWQLVKVK